MSAVAQTDEPRRILVRGPNWLGDIVMSTPGFRALRLAYPNARIVGLVPEGLAPVLAGGSDLDEVWTLASRGVGSMRAMARCIAAERFDLGIVIPESISSALMLRWGRVDRVTGYARDVLRRSLLHEVVAAPPEWGRRRFVSKERFVLGLMASVGAGSSDTRLRLATTSEETARLEGLLANQTPRLGLLDFETRKPIVIAPGASYGDSKCWPAIAYAEFADRMRARGESVVLIGTSSEADRIRAVREAMSHSVLDLGGRLDLGMLKVLLRAARLLVANDAGARHIASAFDVPSVVFFGPTSVAKTSDNLSLIEVLETEHECRPCYRRQCPIDHRCLTTIGVDEALAAADRALHREPTSSPADVAAGARA